MSVKLLHSFPCACPRDHYAVQCVCGWMDWADTLDAASAAGVLHLAVCELAALEALRDAR